MNPGELAQIVALVEGRRRPAAGPPGKPGDPGRPGRDGQRGMDGKPGADGKPGRDGVDGRDGADGKPGRDGVDGRDGADGKPGRDGVDGKPGEPGPRGEDGRGVPRGGRRGQIIAKRSDRDFDTTWTDPPATMVIGGGGGGGGSDGASTADAVACSISGRPDLPTVADALAALFFVPLSVALSGGGTYELGQSIASRDLTWTASKALSSQTLAGIARDPADRAATMVGPFTADTTWALSAVATSGETANASASLVFRSRRHWGVSASAALDDAAILALAGSELATARQQTRTLDATGGRFLWFAWPADFGAPAFWIGGLLNTAWTETVRDVVNAYGHSRSYRIYRSESLQNGAAITVEVR